MLQPNLPEAMIYPSYEVAIPSLGKETVSVTALTVKDLLELASIINFTESKLVEQIVSLIYKKIVDKEKLKVKDVNEFMTKYYIPDRDSLMLGIIVATYGSEYEVQLRCQSCGTVSPYKFDIIKYVVFNKDSFKPNYTEKLHLDQSNVDLELYYPTISDIIALLKKIDARGFKNKEEKDMFNMMVGNLLPFIRKVTVYSKDGSKVVADTTDQNTIANYIMALPKRDYDKLVDKIDELNLSKPYVSYTLKYTCESCGNVNTTTGDITNLFFQMM